MSLKNGRKTKRKLIEDKTDFKLPIIKRDMNKPEEIIKEIEEDIKSNNEGEKSTSEEAGRVTRSRSNTPIKKSQTSSDCSESDLNTNLNDSNGHAEFKNDNLEDSNKEENGIPEAIVVVQSPHEFEASEEYPEVDIELHLEESSDSETSPTLGRCTTRRSQHTNIPTPKTPMPVAEEPVPEIVIEQNGDENLPADPITVSDDSGESFQDKNSEQKDTNDKAPIIIEAEPIKETTESEASEKTELNESIQSSESSLSTRVNVPSDETREIDLTIPDEKESFLNTNKDLSVVEFSRRLRSRTAIHAPTDYRKILLRSNAEKIDYSKASTLSSPLERRPGQKDKTREESPDGPKRFKVGSPASPTLMSYITSPFTKFRNRFIGEDVTTQSTPKLTSYKKQDLTNDFDVTEVAEEATPIEEKKWCSIM